MRIILGAQRSVTGTDMRQKLEWTTLAQRRNLHALKVAHKYVHLESSTCILYLHHNFLHVTGLRDRQTRGSSLGKVYLSLSITSNHSNIYYRIRMLKVIVPFVKA